jgi:2'-5' RNA ligase
MTSIADAGRPWRCFWAVPLPPALRSALAQFVAALRHSPSVDDGWRFSDPESWHLTLAFLGAVEPDAVDAMVERVAAASQHHLPFEATAAGLGGFPEEGRARVLWYGVDANGALADLARDVRAATGVDDVQPWQPHVTLGRSRNRHGANLPRSIAPPTGGISVNEVVLYRSHLGQGPARYLPLARLALGASVAAVTQ